MMKKGILVTLIASFACLVLLAGNSFAVQTCNNVTLKGTGTTPYTPSGLVATFTNTSGGACGSWANGNDAKFFLDVNNTDATYATLLTGFSLGSQFFIQVSGNGSTGELLQVVAIK